MKFNHSNIKSNRLVYENPYQKTYQITATTPTQDKTYFVVDTGERAGIVAEKDNHILLVSQYRFLINGISWEIPGGKVDENETPSQAAVRECLEETGVLCHDIKNLIFYHPGLDTRYNPTHIFYSTNTDTSDISYIHEDEVSEHKWIPLNNCLDMIKTGVISDSFTIIALLTYQSQHTQTHQ